MYQQLSTQSHTCTNLRFLRSSKTYLRIFERKFAVFLRFWGPQKRFLRIFQGILRFFWGLREKLEEKVTKFEENVTSFSAILAEKLFFFLSPITKKNFYLGSKIKEGTANDIITDSTPIELLKNRKKNKCWCGEILMKKKILKSSFIRHKRK